MAERETIRITLFDGSYDDTLWSVPDAVDWLQGLLDQIPEECREASVFQVEKESGYYDSGDTLIFQVYYDRLETEEEASARERKEAEQRRAGVMQREAELRRTYEALKAKFEQ